MGGAATVTWRLTVVAILVVVAGFAAVLAASLQGLARVPDGTIFDGYDVGLLPWMGIGTWLIPIGGFVAAIASAATVWLARAPMLARLATAPALLVVGFWLLLVLVAMAPRSAVPNVAPTSSDLQTVVYSSPVNTILFLLIPAGALVLIAAAARPRTRTGDAAIGSSTRS